MNDIELDKIKKIEVEILKEFIKICNEFSLQYFALGGTMLGAVRHHGFIPWDDDIDIGMFRDDYEKFIRFSREMLPNHLFLQNINTDPDCLIPFTKIRDSRTTFIETSCKNRKMNHGIYIDIFPLDFFPQNDCEKKKISRKKKIIRYRMYREYTIPKENQSSQIKEFIKRFISTILRILYPTVNQAIIAGEHLFMSVKHSDYIANYYGAWGDKEIVPAEWYGEGSNALFEGISIKIPKHYEKWLTQVYGNYMEYPPVEKRTTHHYAEIIDPDTSYLEYIK